AVGLVLGSGLGTLAETLENRVVIPYDDIPGWPRSTVHGHSGQLVLGYLEGCAVVAQQGRAHFYEGYDAQQITFPIRVMKLLGVEPVSVSNASRALNPPYQVGDLMLLNDQINFVGMGGHNPQIGPNHESFGPRFIRMAQTYNREPRQLAIQVAGDT